ncbi:SGNH/GDSL hydrolase family protein [Mucilaginibacter sp. RS28]|uniref:SGNH/GDSL hydrolase family protein n=1 Tax=Mucilaginibacter straminoryzae TaxID=2932774 RepID=A0A9X1X4L2_9SPHI|nr:GDSL-type esterase/lipase family protein [Mucilaginibacter straminoryzae]MCJ8210924.1 SGNH/GDSL hydrolase family protein [Mucilaginibacter straminoryzae]
MNPNKAFLFFSFFLGFISLRSIAQQGPPPPPVSAAPAAISVSPVNLTPSCSAAAKFYSKDSIVITTFGASTVHGMYGSDFQTPLLQDFQHCYTGKIVDITNNGVPGETTTQGLKRFPDAIAGRTGFVLIFMGVNDAWALANKKIKISETERNMRYYIEECQKRHLIPIIGTLQFINDTKSDENKIANLYIKQINNLYKKLAGQYKVYIADINKALGRDFSLYKDDVHPNAKGNALIAYVWYDVISQVIEQVPFLVIGLNQNYPNPVRDNTTFGFSLSQSGRVQISLLSMSGASVKNILDEYQNSGYHELTVNMADVSPGIYLYTMQVGGQRMTRKIMIAR